jgi:hypothetical protein
LNQRPSHEVATPNASRLRATPRPYSLSVSELFGLRLLLLLRDRLGCLDRARARDICFCSSARRDQTSAMATSDARVFAVTPELAIAKHSRASRRYSSALLAISLVRYRTNVADQWSVQQIRAYAPPGVQSEIWRTPIWRTTSLSTSSSSRRTRPVTLSITHNSCPHVGA